MSAAANRFHTVVGQTEQARRRVRVLAANRQWEQAEPNPVRLASYLQRRAALQTPRGAEALQGDTTDFQPSAFLTLGALVRRAVAYIEVNVPGRAEAGTGFLVSPTLLLTNQHVIADADAARGAQVVFDREMDEFGRPRASTAFTLAPDRLALFSQQEELDYALIAIGERLSGTAALAEFGYCALSNRPDKHAIGMNVNIIQHPQGLPKMISVRHNLLEFRTDRTLLYETDTDHGSSGAPVFNDLWELVALHHYGEPFLERRDENGQPIPTTVNEGVRISAIYNHLGTRLSELAPDARSLLDAALSYDRAPAQVGGDRPLGPPRPSMAARENRPILARSDIMAASSADELRVTIPLEITVRVAAAAATAAPPPPAVATALQAKTLVSAAEKLNIDPDYANRSGFDETFIAGLPVKLPGLSRELAQQLAPLRPGEPEAAAGELKYEHFSLKLHKTRRMAIFTATNIDGKTYLEVDRKTGQVRSGAEAGEVWFQDPRVSASFYLDQSFYSAWSTYFDRGHLTRRSDPSWGSREDAQRANADTFHFTNCSPQHFRFNQSATFWQGAERFVLERGVLDEEEPPRIVVIQGPIFADAIDRWADDVQIPSSFFKVVVWKSKRGPKSVGIVVDQSALLDEQRHGMAQPKDVPVNINHWRVPIPTIEQRAGLTFGDAVRKADTIRTRAQPHVGEAQILIRTSEDLLGEI